MCGRAAQTVHASHVAAASLGIKNQSRNHNDVAPSELSDGKSHSYVLPDGKGMSESDNYNMSPGMDAAVIWMDGGELKMDRKV